jgi:hypothetical protein
VVPQVKDRLGQRLCCYKKSVSIYKKSEKSMKLFG